MVITEKKVAEQKGCTLFKRGVQLYILIIEIWNICMWFIFFFRFNFKLEIFLLEVIKFKFESISMNCS